MNFKKITLLCLLLTVCAMAWGQILDGKITYQRKTNLYKKYQDTWKDVKDDIKEADRNKMDIFELYYNDTCSLFQPEESNIREKMSWATSKNTVLSYLKIKKLLSVKTAWSENLYIYDDTPSYAWRITESMRNIAGYDCIKAYTYVQDTIKIFAWYTPDIVPSIGPESIQGLPGAILGLATEDGGVVYMATKVETSTPQFQDKIPQPKKKDLYTNKELRSYLEKQFSSNKWGKQMIKNIFFW